MCSTDPVYGHYLSEKGPLITGRDLGFTIYILIVTEIT